jgi:hypothetical protein
VYRIQLDILNKIPCIAVSVCMYTYTHAHTRTDTYIQRVSSTVEAVHMYLACAMLTDAKTTANRGLKYHYILVAVLACLV